MTCTFLGLLLKGWWEGQPAEPQSYPKADKVPGKRAASWGAVMSLQLSCVSHVEAKWGPWVSGYGVYMCYPLFSRPAHFKAPMWYKHSRGHQHGLPNRLIILVPSWEMNQSQISQVAWWGIWGGCTYFQTGLCLSGPLLFCGEHCPETSRAWSYTLIPIHSAWEPWGTLSPPAATGWVRMVKLNISFSVFNSLLVKWTKDLTSSYEKKEESS